jgi:octaprenyl-diphosphate synthase
MTLNEIKAPVETHLVEYEKCFQKSIKSKSLLLNTIMRFLLKRKGKQMRPLFVFFSAGLFGQINSKTHRAGALIEMLHTATLVHDDVVDDSNERRGFFSLNALWKNKISVLVGDYLLSRGLLLAIENDDFDLLKIVSESVKEMSEGELLQIQKSRTLDISEDVYYEIIRQKTASLIASCLAAGAASAGATFEQVKEMKLIGEKIGMAFQIKDDLMDFDTNRDKGKPSASDIKERKITLPLIYLLNNSNYLEKRKILGIVKRNGKTPEKTAWLLEKVKDSGGVEYASGKMMQFKNEAIEMLQKLPDNQARKSLIKLIEFTIARQN